MRKLIALTLTLFLILSLGVSANAATVQISPQKLSVNGTDIACEKYNIDGNNYFKLRDVAQLMNSTAGQFSVGWDAAANTVSIVTGEGYVANGTELVTGQDNSATAVVSSQTIVINGQVRSDIAAYNIGGSNFFKLRDLGGALGLYVDYDAATNTAILNSTTSAGSERKPASMGETNALKKALLYLEISAFSYDGLVEQLEYDGFSHSEAVYGVDNCGADWYEQAVKKAYSYLDIMPFSRSGLIAQLEFEGFTHEQALYGVEQNGY